MDLWVGPETHFDRTDSSEKCRLHKRQPWSPLPGPGWEAELQQAAAAASAHNERAQGYSQRDPVVVYCLSGFLEAWGAKAKKTHLF